LTNKDQDIENNNTTTTTTNNNNTNNYISFQSFWSKYDNTAYSYDKKSKSTTNFNSDIPTKRFYLCSYDQK
jgi:competence transcription factor ComK